MRKIILAAAVAAIALASCVKESAPAVSGSDAIQLGGSVMNVNTRGAGAINGDFTSFAAGVVGYDDSTNPITNPIFVADQVTFVKGSLTAIAGEVYPTSGNVNFVGYAPVATSVASGVANFTIDGQDDVMYAPVQTGSKISTAPVLAFGHKLTQLQFKVIAESSTAATVWSTIKKIMIVDQHNTFALDLAAGTLTPTGAATNNLVAYEGSLAVSETEPKVAGYAMIEALQSPVKAVIVSERAGGEVSIDVSIPGSFVAGTAYAITFNLLGTEQIQLGATVTDWATGAPQTVNVE